MLALVSYSLKPVKLLGPCKRTQQCWELLALFASVCMGLYCTWAEDSVREKTRREFLVGVRSRSPEAVFVSLKYYFGRFNC